jgi:hypothetical protein
VLDITKTIASIKIRLPIFLIIFPPFAPENSNNPAHDKSFFQFIKKLKGKSHAFSPYQKVTGISV